MGKSLNFEAVIIGLKDYVGDSESLENEGINSIQNSLLHVSNTSSLV
jgi:hypothetical protein